MQLYMKLTFQQKNIIWHQLNNYRYSRETMLCVYKCLHVSHQLKINVKFYNGKDLTSWRPIADIPLISMLILCWKQPQYSTTHKII